MRRALVGAVIAGALSSVTHARAQTASANPDGGVDAPIADAPADAQVPNQESPGPGVVAAAQPVSTPTRSTHRSYRAYVVAADVGWLVVGALATWANDGLDFTSPQAHSPGMRLLELGALGGYLASAPVVHLVEHNSRSAGISFGLRLGLSLLGGEIGYYATDGGKPSSGPFPNGLGAALGAPIGALAAMVIDWSVLATTDEPVAGPGITWVPSLTVMHDHAALTLIRPF